MFCVAGIFHEPFKRLYEFFSVDGDSPDVSVCSDRVSWLAVIMDRDILVGGVSNAVDWVSVRFMQRKREYVA